MESAESVFENKEPQSYTPLDDNLVNSVGVSQTASSPKINQPDKPKKKAPVGLIVVISIFFLIILGAGIGGFIAYSMLQQQIQTLNSLAQEQTQNFESLDEQYTKIVENIRQAPSPEPETEVETLPNQEEAPSESSLSIENSPAVQNLRTQSGLYRETENIVSNIDQVSNSIDSVYNNSQLAPFLPNKGAIVVETNVYTDQVSQVIDYLQVMNEVSLDAILIGSDIELAFASVGPDNLDEGLDQLEVFVDEFETSFNRVIDYDVSGLPEDFQESHNDLITEYPPLLDSLDGFIQSIRDLNIEELEQSATDIAVRSESLSSKQETQSITFWTSGSIIENLDSMKDKWERYGDSL